MTPHPFTIEEFRQLAWARLTGNQEEIRFANIGWEFNNDNLQERVDRCVDLIRHICMGFHLGEGYVRNGAGAAECVEHTRPLVGILLADYPNLLGVELGAEIRERFRLLERASAANHLFNKLDARLSYAKSVKRLKTALRHIETARELVTSACSQGSIESELRRECEDRIEQVLRDLTQPGG